MSTNLINTIIKLKRGSADSWITNDYILAQGEPGYDMTNNIFKIGNGINTWSDLPGIFSNSSPKGSFSDLTDLQDSEPGIYIKVKVDDPYNGYAYYWNGSELGNPLFLYNAVAIGDNTISRDKLNSDLKNKTDAIAHKLDIYALTVTTISALNELQDIASDTYYSLTLAAGELGTNSPQTKGIFIQVDSNNQLFITQTGLVYQRTYTNSTWTEFSPVYYTTEEISDLIDTLIANQVVYYYYLSYGAAAIEENGEMVEKSNVLRLWRYDNPQDVGDTTGDTGTVVAAYEINGGSSQATNINFERITPASIVATPNDTINIVGSFSDYETGGEAVAATYTVKVGNSTVLSGTAIQCKDNSGNQLYEEDSITPKYMRFNLTDYLNIGTQTVTVTFTDEYGNMAIRRWTVQIIDVSLSSNFDDNIVRTAGTAVNFLYTPNGAISKTIHFKLDGVEIDTVTSTSSGAQVSYTIPANYGTHGAHFLEAYITATVNGNSIESNHIYKNILYYNADVGTPIVSSLYRQDYYGTININQYDTLNIPYVVYPINDTYKNIIINISDGTTTTTNNLVLENATNTFSFKGTTVGTYTITITSASIYSVTIRVVVNDLGYNIEPVTTGLAFDFDPTGYSNSSTNRLWKDKNNSNIQLSVSNNFDWDNGGYQIETVTKADNTIEENSVFVVKAGTRATISYDLFGTDPKIDGSEFKLIFKTKNVSNINATFLTCLSDNIGLKMNVRKAELKNSSNTLDIPYSEEDIIEFDYNINPSVIGSSVRPLILSYEDGTPYLPLGYIAGTFENNAWTGGTQLYQNTPVPITIGSDDCDVYVYRMKAYTVSLDNSQILANFIADARNSEDMVNRYLRNQIYDENNLLTPASVAEACPDLKIIKIEAPYFTNNNSETISNTSIECIHVNGDPILDNWKAINCGHSGQGTTSNEYGDAGRNIDIKMNGDDVILTMGDGETIYTGGSGKVALTPTSIPNNYFNIKVNIASSENANNALLANRYDRFLPYLTPAKRKNSNTKTTMEFVNCVVFIKENNSDLTTHREFNDTDWHFYAIGNIGDSKETDKTRANDPTDTKEFCVEILDNTLSNSIFDTGVVNLIVETLPTTGNLLTDYYLDNGNGSFTLKRYLNNSWVTVNENIDTIQNGAVALVSTLPQTGLINVEYYIENPGNYTMYTWNGNDWSSGTAREDIVNGHMANSIDPLQWNNSNNKYASLYAPENDEKFGNGTFEFRYEHKSTTTAQHLANMQIWRDFYTWVITSTDTAFQNELSNWFVEEAALYYYLYTERYTMTDNRSKNSFWHWSKIYITEAEAEQLGTDAQYYIIDNTAAAINNGYRFDFWDYDNDTALGINNSGEMTMTYGREDIDFLVPNVPTSGYVFNGARSVFFRRIRLLKHPELVAMYKDREKEGAWTSTSFINEFDNWQKQFPERLWLEDYLRKYYRAYSGESYDNSLAKLNIRFLNTMMTGRRKYFRRQFERDQNVYIGSKYLASEITADQIMFRCNTPQSAVVLPDYTLEIVPYSDMYLSVKFGNTTENQIRATAGNTYIIECPLTTMDETAILIYAASRIQSLNDLSGCYIHDNDFSKAEKLKTLIIGNDTPGYTSFISTLTLGNNPILETLNIQNCNSFTDTEINLNSLINLKDFYAGGSNITSISFANFGKLQNAELPATISSITMSNLNNLVDNNLDIEGYTNIKILQIVNGQIDTKTLVNTTFNTLTTLTLNGYDWDFTNDTIDWNGNLDNFLIEKIYNKPNLTSNLTGTIRVNSIPQRFATKYQEKWGERFNIVGTIIPECKITYLNYNDVKLYEEWVEENAFPNEPIAAGNLNTPTKPSSEQYTYTFSHWAIYLNGEILDIPYGFADQITSNLTLKAVYTEALREFTVRWKTGTVPASNQIVQFADNIWNSKNANNEDITTIQTNSGVSYGNEAICTTNFDKVKVYETTVTYQAVPTPIAANLPYYYELVDTDTYNLTSDVEIESGKTYYLKTSFLEAYTFMGWNKSTAKITGEYDSITGEFIDTIDVYALWRYAKIFVNHQNILQVKDSTDLQTVNLKDTKNLSDMTSAEIAAVLAVNRATEFFEDRDYFPYVMGQDYTFENVEEDTIVAVGNDLILDGTQTIIPTDTSGNTYQLFAEDSPSFTMAIDYHFTANKFNNAPSSGKNTLVSCFENPGNGNDGFRIFYNSNKTKLMWGDKESNITHMLQRDIVVLRHIKGDTNLYIYAFNGGSIGTENGYSNEYQYTTLNRTAYNYTNAPLAFGNITTYDENTQTFVASNDTDYLGAGIIHWCKIWWDDLGDSVAKELASWSRDEQRQEYFKVYTDSTNTTMGSPYKLYNSNLRAKASFTSNNLLKYTHQMNARITNAGGWGGYGGDDRTSANYKNSMHYFLQNKYYFGMPNEFKCMIAEMAIPSTIGGQSTTTSNYASYIYLNCITEEDGKSGAGYSSEGGKRFSWNTTNDRRLKFHDVFTEDYSLNSAGNAVHSGAAEPIYEQGKGLYRDNGTGVKEYDIWQNDTNNTGYIFLFADTLARKGINPTTRIGVNDELIGGWVAAANWWLRSPYTGTVYHFWHVSSSGATGINYIRDANVWLGVSPSLSFYVTLSE